jgi:AAHS family 4-hydroxybenzoate transporter-like MFS transporter
VTGPLTDRFGRRPMMLGTVIWFSVLTLAVTQASNLDELLVLRFLAGLGLGSLVPMAVVVSSENAPLRRRATMVTLATCGYSIGAASGGLLAAQLIPLYGWPSIFWVGGIAPLFWWWPCGPGCRNRSACWRRADSLGLVILFRLFASRLLQSL